MAHQCIKYRLNIDGTVPDFLYLGDDGVGGAYSVDEPFLPPPLDMTMIGISKDNATGRFEVFNTQQDLENYLSDHFGDSLVFLDEEGQQTAPFNAAEEAAQIWAKLNALNGN